MRSSPRDPAQAERFRRECTLANRPYFRVILALGFLMESGMLLLDLTSTYLVHGTSFYPQYVYLYVGMMVAGPVFLFLFRTAREDGRLRRLEGACLLFLTVWGAVFSICDVVNGFSSYLFIQFLVINSLVIRMPPRFHCGVNLLGFLIYAVGIGFGRLGLVRQFAETVNPLLMLIFSCILIRVNDNRRFKEFSDKEVIREQHRKLEFYANNDYLTRIPNRKSILEYLDGLLESRPSSVACLMLDIDFFKLFNDTYGHIAGDSCLIRLAAALERATRDKGGRIGRYGGEEFLVVFSGRDPAGIRAIAEEILKTVRRENIAFPESRTAPEVTVSIGIYVGDGSESRDTLIRRSDSALYRAKNEGRNRAAVYTP